MVDVDDRERRMQLPIALLLPLTLPQFLKHEVW
jgi:hypothetical protein